MTTGPDFFVIGGQKCGTTTLYEDLRLHPGIWLAEKESSALRGADLQQRELIRRYERIFGETNRDVLRGEVSTRYTMLPDDPEVSHNAALVAPDARILYIVREPVARVISHHHHDYGLGLVGPDINEAVIHHPALINNTCYGTQLEPWVAAFGRNAIRVVRFEDYMANRSSGIHELLRFIGATDGGGIDPGDTAHNAAATKYIAPGRWGRLSRNPWYRQTLRRLLPERLRRRINSAVLPKAPPRPPPPSAETVRHLVERLGPEVEKLAALTGRSDWWDLDGALANYTQLQ